jgi:multisubunit Na+/H+ antiporter MnhC subunit
MANASQARDSAEAGARRAAGKLQDDTVTKVGRFGVAGLGVVYLLVAWLAAQVALGGSDKSADNTGALKELAENSFGTVLLAVLAVAFAAYAVWQVIQAAADFHHVTDDRKRTLKRVAAVAKALIGVALSISSFRLVAGSGQKDSSEQQKDLTARLLGAPGGQALVVVIGVAVVAFAAFLAYRAWTRSFLEKLDRRPSHRVELLGVAGYLARAVVFGVLGVLVVVAGLRDEASRSRGLDAALKTLADQPYGTALLLATALGLAAFGVYELITARHAREG